jgi:hypothetical protein
MDSLEYPYLDNVLGASHHTEWWIPAEELNNNIVEIIEIIGEYRKL